MYRKMRHDWDNFAVKFNDYDISGILSQGGI